MKLYLAALAGNLGMVSAGLFFGWASPSLPLLMQDDTPVVLTSDEASWVASLFTLGAAAGAVVSALIVNLAGRKNTMLLAAVPAIIGWLMIAFATTPWELYISRFISGIASGTSYTVTPMYLGEISPAKIRGILGSMLTVAAKSGVLVEYAIGPFVAVRTLAWISLLVPILFVAVFVWLPETPYHLMRCERKDDARKSLSQLRGSEEIDEEIAVIEKSVTNDLKNSGGLREILLVPGNRKALIVVVGLVVTQQLSGSQAVVAYAESIFDAANSGLQGKYLTIILGVVQVSCTLVSSAFVDCGGRKPFLIASALGSSVSTCIVAVYFYLDRESHDLSNVSWLPAAGVMIYVVMYAVGLAALPFTVVGEVFPTNVKALGSTIGIVVCNLFSFAVTKLYQVVADRYGIHVAFWAFSVCGLLGALFTLLYVPETKGKTLQEIQDKLHRGRTEVGEKDNLGYE